MSEAMLKELQIIKKLLVADLILRDVSATKIADFLGMDAGDFSRMFPVKKLQKGGKK